MLKKTLTYEDYNGKTVTEDFYFNLSKAELVELQLSEKKGFAEYLQEIVASEDGKLIIENFKAIILMAYGKKTQELRDEFAGTEAYSMLFVELATDSDAAAAFINAVVPAGMTALGDEPEETPKREVENIELPNPASHQLTDEQLMQKDPNLMTQDELRRAYLYRAKQQ